MSSVSVKNSIDNPAMGDESSVRSASPKLINGHPELSFKESFREWWGSKPLDKYETDVLSILPFYPEADSSRKAKTLNVELNDKDNNYIHEFYIENKNKLDSETPIKELVIIHGYGASLGFFYKNFDSLSKINGIKIHAIDLLGFGLSSRPNFPKNDCKTIEDVCKSEDFFVDSLEQWRKARNLDKFVLIGHSLGGYLSSCYTLKYGKDHVEKLVLISPVGVERSEYSLLEDQTLAETSKPMTTNSNKKIDDQQLEPGPEVANEYYESQSEAIGRHSISSDSDNSSIVDERAGQSSRAPRLRGFLMKAWEHHVSPFTFLRLLGPAGPQLISRWSFRRFGTLSDYDELLRMHIYSYKTFTAKGSGEYALTRILAPGALARLPLIDRLPGKLHGIPTLWLYGENDWMSKSSGKAIVNEINKKEGKKLAKF
ncbi:hypothetical protein PACTADRAFT_50673, partial [Pachysolen tannophilus NRRL Y-2460]